MVEVRFTGLCTSHLSKFVKFFKAIDKESFQFGFVSEIDRVGAHLTWVDIVF